MSKDYPRNEASLENCVCIVFDMCPQILLGSVEIKLAECNLKQVLRYRVPLLPSHCLII